MAISRQRSGRLRLGTAAPFGAQAGVPPGGAAPLKRGNKFNAQAQKVDGVRYDSKGEFQRYCALQLEQRAGVVRALEVHPAYDLWVGGVLVCRYIADFRYHRRMTDMPVSWTPVVEDHKSEATLTPEAKIKLKLMEGCLGIKVLLTGPIAKRRAWKVRKA